MARRENEVKKTVATKNATKVESLRKQSLKVRDKFQYYGLYPSLVTRTTTIQGVPEVLGTF